ncbi:hypothetical protein [Pleionea litopenaei]|uniref:Uncharacterized protein n=1 Tax=Pleionea litopenaei TaxID=3070815 RepID=A0AA51RUT1_9GAMM|nr:hypothetical protein [Pleionea sp. HL-JVS1]WMS87868.1 hypothetical protein Q9312_02825 [Pleionea sp. HL-JVS1]
MYKHITCALFLFILLTLSSSAIGKKLYEFKGDRDLYICNGCTFDQMEEMIEEKNPILILDKPNPFPSQPFIREFTVHIMDVKRENFIRYNVEHNRAVNGWLYYHRLSDIEAQKPTFNMIKSDYLMKMATFNSLVSASAKQSDEEESVCESYGGPNFGLDSVFDTVGTAFDNAELNDLRAGYANQISQNHDDCLLCNTTGWSVSTPWFGAGLNYRDHAESWQREFPDGTVYYQFKPNATDGNIFTINLERSTFESSQILGRGQVVSNVTFNLSQFFSMENGVPVLNETFPTIGNACILRQLMEALEQRGYEVNVNGNGQAGWPFDINGNYQGCAGAQGYPTYVRVRLWPTGCVKTGVHVTCTWGRSVIPVAHQGPADLCEAFL